MKHYLNLLPLVIVLACAVLGLLWFSPVAGTPASEIVRMMAGRRMDELFPRSAHTPGDVILELNRARVKTSADVAKALGKLKEGDVALLRVKRGGGAVFVAVPFGERK